jgi:hypothetical protein
MPLARDRRRAAADAHRAWEYMRLQSDREPHR